MSKIGEGSLGAAMRTGLQEVRNALYADSNIAQKQTEYGMYGHLTPGEVADSRRADGYDLEDERSQSSTLDQTMAQAKTREDPSAERSMNRETVEMER